MAWVYILRGSSGRHYIGSAIDLDAGFAQHVRGHTATTKRLGDSLEIVARKQVSGLGEARELERKIKTKEKSPARNLSFATVEQPRKLSGLVGSSILPLALSISRP
jgi:predicted GIY-YIG superfamily endonuclease